MHVSGETADAPQGHGIPQGNAATRAALDRPVSGLGRALMHMDDVSLAWH